jgi:hypothetical protein
VEVGTVGGAARTPGAANAASAGVDRGIVRRDRTVTRGSPDVRAVPWEPGWEPDGPGGGS